MKAARVDYVRADSVAHALERLDSTPEARVLAGGQSLITLMNLRLARPALLVDIGNLSVLDEIVSESTSLLLGALVRHHRLESDSVVRKRLPMLSEAAHHIGHTAIRHRGTLGGSLSHADPAAELPAVTVALEATFHVESHRRGKREIAAQDFFRSYYTTALAEDEALTWVQIPILGPNDGWGFVEFARRPGDFAMAGAVCTARRGRDGKLTQVRAVLIAASGVPLVVSDDSATGETPSEALAADLAIAWAPRIPADGYKRRLATVALRRGLNAAMQSALRSDQLQSSGGTE